MKRFPGGLVVCVAVLYSGVSLGQSPHAHDARAPVQKTPERPRTSPVVAAPLAAAVPSEITSAFSDYRRFNADEPLVDWRAANDEVKNAGGHVGLMRSQDPRGGRPRAEQKTATPPPKGHH